MGIPSQVEEAAQMAEQLHERLYQEPDSEVIDDQEEEPKEESQEEHEEADVPHDDDVEELRKFKERYLSLKGKYDAEVPRLHSELREFKQSVFDKLSSFSQKPQEEQEVKPKENERIAKFKEEYGEEFVDTLRELFKQEFSNEIDPRLTQATRQLQEQVSSVEETQITAARQNFGAYLDQQVKGDWKALWNGQDAKFLEFLNKPDPSGLYTYGELAQAYNDKWDADKLTKIFNTYFEEQAPKKPEQPNPAKTAMVAPSRSTQHTAPASTDKRIWTQESMAEFQRDDRRGKYTPEESLALWEDLMRAPSENRMR